MLPTSLPKQPSIRPPHPLAVALIARLTARPDARVLEFGGGSDRNAAALRATGLAVITLDGPLEALPVPPEPFDALLSTHGLLHGTLATIGGNVAWLTGALATRAPFFATFGSVRDARFGRGTRIDAASYAPQDGDERGVAHAYFTRERLEALLAPRLAIEAIEEAGVDAIAGAWAHRSAPLQGAVHWFVRAARR